jgi:hypothetical protein
MGVAMLHGMLVLCLILMPQEKPPTEKEVRDVLRKVKEGVAEEKRALEDQALKLAQQAEIARREGRLQEAAVLARKAVRLSPESLPLRRLARTLEAEETANKQRDANLRKARERLDEALDAAVRLHSQGETRLARELVEAVLTAAERFPVGVEVMKAVTRAEALLKDPNQGGVPKEPAAEKIPVEPQNVPPPPLPAPPPLNIPSRKLLAKLMNVDWQQVTLMEALQQVATETGVQLRIDPLLVRHRVFEERRLTWQAQQQPAERLLRRVMEQCGTDYIHMNNGQIYLTTKQEAMTIILERRTPPLAVPQPPPPRRPPPGPEKLPEAPLEDTPAYLESGKAFLSHIDRLLVPVPMPPEGKP